MKRLITLVVNNKGWSLCVAVVLLIGEYCVHLMCVKYDLNYIISIILMLAICLHVWNVGVGKD